MQFHLNTTPNSKQIVKKYPISDQRVQNLEPYFKPKQHRTYTCRLYKGGAPLKGADFACERIGIASCPIVTSLCSRTTVEHGKPFFVI